MKHSSSTIDHDYRSLLETRARSQWKKIGTGRRVGVATPLFSIYSEKSIGIGELPDLKLLIDWCQKTGMSIIQLLPINDVGFDFRPYDAQSSFAIDPMYLALSELRHANAQKFKKEVETLRKQFPPGSERVNYAVKGAKLALLWKIFKEASAGQDLNFTKYSKENAVWLNEYALYKTIKEIHKGKDWESWDKPYKERAPDLLRKTEKKYKEILEFQRWLQWQLDEQFREVKAYAEKKDILLMGDLPFLVSRDSADVWSHQDYFKLGLVSGAPPDAFFANGQRWGMPPYAWEKIEANQYDYVIQKLRYAENFYDVYRIDHVVGMFRVWTIAMNEPLESAGLHGVFDPKDESAWEEHGRKILSAMIDNASMLPCAEDLGVVPDCSPKVLEEFGMVGMDVVRWKKNWKTDREFTAPDHYRKNSITVFSTHDMTSLAGWWEFEAGTVDEKMFERKCESRGIPFDSVKDRLFDLEHSSHGRLRWRKELNNRAALLAILNRNEHEVQDFLDLHQETFDEKNRFWFHLGLKGKMKERTSEGLVRSILEHSGKTASIFTIHLFQDWLSLSRSFRCDPWHFRINFPGTLDERNWSLVIPFSLEKINSLEINKTIKQINARSDRM